VPARIVSYAPIYYHHIPSAVKCELLSSNATLPNNRCFPIVIDGPLARILLCPSHIIKSFRFDSTAAAVLIKVLQRNGSSVSGL